MKANPAKANYATSGAGTVPHFAGLLLGQAAGVPLTHVAYSGGAPAAQDLIGGQIPLMVDTASETMEHHKAGKVRILAVTGEQRSKALPDVPTLKEQGINITADAFFGLYGPPGMAPDLVARIDRAVADALRAPDVQEKIYGFGLVPNHARGRGTRRDPGGAPEALGSADQGVGVQGRVTRAWGATVARSLARMPHDSHRTPQVLISEVGPRDGLQSVKATCDAAQVAGSARCTRRACARSRSPPSCRRSCCRRWRTRPRWCGMR